MLEVKWKEQAHYISSKAGVVSILVMLEVKWKVIYFIDLDGGGVGFNPCYVGSKMESPYYNLEMGKAIAFQSLLCWK